MPLVSEDEVTREVARLNRSRGLLPACQKPSRIAGRLGSIVTESTVGLQEVLSGRCSVRTYTSRQIPESTLDEVLAMALSVHERQWPPAQHGDPDLQLLVSARQVQGLAPGIHEYPFSGESRRADYQALVEGLEQAYTQAPALILVAGSILRAGGSAYGGLLVQAGSLGHSIWLAARTHGLECTVWGRSDHRGTQAARVRDRSSRHLFTVSLGYGAASESAYITEEGASNQPG